MRRIRNILGRMDPFRKILLVGWVGLVVYLFVAFIRAPVLILMLLILLAFLLGAFGDYYAIQKICPDLPQA